MNINITTKFNIGDKVWALLSKMNAERDYFDRGRTFTMCLYEMEISAIRYIVTDNNETYIQYFLKGLSSYEGENWFDEPNETDELPGFLDQCIFLNKESAERAYRHYQFENALCDINEPVNDLEVLIDKRNGNETINEI